MAIDVSAPKGSSKAYLERRALLIQLGGYTLNGDERLYSTFGRVHLEAVTARKVRALLTKTAPISGPLMKRISRRLGTRKCSPPSC